MFIDTHSHLYEESFGGDRQEAMNRAFDNDVKFLILPNINVQSIKPMNDLHSAFPQNTAMAMGLHPTDVTVNWREDMKIIENELLSQPDKYVAVGEVGIDLYWDKSMLAEQIEVFDIQIRLASRLGLPVIIHCRDGLKETLDVLRGQSQLPPLIFHSFGGSVDDVALIREIASDVMFGINGIVTFKNSGLRSVLSDIGLSSMLLETDSPYLAPVPKRGKRNESSYIPFIAQTIADTLGTDIKEVADVTTGNAIRLFNLKL